MHVSFNLCVLSSQTKLNTFSWVMCVNLLMFARLLHLNFHVDTFLTSNWMPCNSYLNLFSHNGGIFNCCAWLMNMYESSVQSEAEAVRVSPEWKLPTHFMPTLSAVSGLAATRISQWSYYHNTLQSSDSDESVVYFVTRLVIVVQKKVFYYCLLFYYELSKVGVSWT